MTSKDQERELLVRYLDGRTSGSESDQVLELLRTDADAREFLRTLSEQAIMVADVERIVASREQALHLGEPRIGEIQGSAPHRVNRTPTRRVASALILGLVAILIAIGLSLRSSVGSGRILITKATGSSRFFGAKGRVDNTLTSGMILGAGDTLETRSCDAWIDLKLRDGTTLTMGGNSTLRFLRGGTGHNDFELSQGSLWVTPSSGAAEERVLIRTPTLQADLMNAQFDIQTSSAESIIRVNAGSGRVTQTMDGDIIDLAQGQQAHASLNRKGPLVATAQLAPTNRWACDLGRVPEVILGRWLPSSNTERARLGAEPLLWPVSEQKSVLLYAVALAAWKSSEHPVVLHDDSRIRFRGRTERSETVRFGFSVQKLRGVFAGKFEVDVPAQTLGSTEQTWEVDLPLREFRALHPQLALTPEGLELTDVYALTIRENAGLEIHHIELFPRK